MRFLSACLIVCLSAPALWAENYPHDDRQPSQMPRLVVGCDVEWVDGSRGKVTGPAQWRETDAQGQWYYIVQFGGSGSLRWLLPESGLQLIDAPLSCP